jgi:hypothetical protein
MPLRRSCSQTGVIGGSPIRQDEKQGFGSAIDGCSLGEGGRAFLPEHRPGAGFAFRSSMYSSSSPSCGLEGDGGDAGGGPPADAGRRSCESKPVQKVSRAQTITNRRQRPAACGKNIGIKPRRVVLCKHHPTSPDAEVCGGLVQRNLIIVLLAWRTSSSGDRQPSLHLCNPAGSVWVSLPLDGVGDRIV